ncbi:MAG: hypothetical protein P0Y64_01955 [Candidatus Sphingomonas colombiensis]|nr:hypothetical protein [Sphingomonas sp.]WEK43619.1 MAG: hypothetical protein P0Y64_01955 [Sphingomonas sp.]
MTVTSLRTPPDTSPSAPMSLEGARILTGAALRSFIAERMKQVDRHGRTLDSDLATNDRADLALAGASYANAAIDQLTSTAAIAPDLAKPDPLTWPWATRYWKPEQDPRGNLVKAVALLWAAIDRLDREAGPDIAREVAA